VLLQLALVEAGRIKRPGEVLMRMFMGGLSGRLSEPLTKARDLAIGHFAKKNVNLNIEYVYQNDMKTKLGWSPTDCMDWILEADAHWMGAHFSEASIGKTRSWTVPNCLSNLDRLEYHLGNMMGAGNRCSVYRQDKMGVYTIMHDYCLPTIAIDLPKTFDPEAPVISPADFERLEKYVFI